MIVLGTGVRERSRELMAGLSVMNLKKMVVASKHETLRQAKHGGESAALVDSHSLEPVSELCHCCSL